jgi:hypothetical protein
MDDFLDLFVPKEWSGERKELTTHQKDVLCGWPLSGSAAVAELCA